MDLTAVLVWQCYPNSVASPTTTLNKVFFHNFCHSHHPTNSVKTIRQWNAFFFYYYRFIMTIHTNLRMNPKFDQNFQQHRTDENWRSSEEQIISSSERQFIPSLTLSWQIFFHYLFRWFFSQETPIQKQQNSPFPVYDSCLKTKHHYNHIQTHSLQLLIN